MNIFFEMKFSKHIQTVTSHAHNERHDFVWSIGEVPIAKIGFKIFSPNAVVRCIKRKLPISTKKISGFVHGLGPITELFALAFFRVSSFNFQGFNPFFYSDIHTSTSTSDRKSWVHLNSIRLFFKRNLLVRLSSEFVVIRFN